MSNTIERNIQSELVSHLKTAAGLTPDMPLSMDKDLLFNGINSLMVMKFMASLKKVYHIEVRFSHLLVAPSITSIVVEIESRVLNAQPNC